MKALRYFRLSKISNTLLKRTLNTQLVHKNQSSLYSIDQKFFCTTKHNTEKTKDENFGKNSKEKEQTEKADKNEQSEENNDKENTDESQSKI